MPSEVAIIVTVKRSLHDKHKGISSITTPVSVETIPL